MDSQPKRFRDYAFDKQKGRDSALRATAQRFGKSIIPQIATKKARSLRSGLGLEKTDYGMRCGGVTELPSEQVTGGIPPTVSHL
jgi:hypothetical protein